MPDGQFGGGPVPQTNPAQPAPSLLEMAQAAMGSGDNPYGGRTLAQILEGGAPYTDMPGWSSADYGGGGPSPGSSFAADWANQPATNENVSAGIQRGARYRPEFAQTLQSSGAEGGFFSIPGTQAETNIPWGYYDDPRKENPAPGLIGMSTNNWRLLPKSFQDPQYVMRAGHILERAMATNPAAYVVKKGAGAGGSSIAPSMQGYPYNLGGGGHGFPLSYGLGFGPRQSFFPGQIEPWQPEGGPGGMGTGVT